MSNKKSKKSGVVANSDEQIAFEAATTNESNESNELNKSRQSQQPNKSTKKRIRKFIRTHCSKSRIILFLLFVLVIGITILVLILLTKNPYIFIRPHCKASYGKSSLLATFDTLGKLETGKNNNDNNGSEYNTVNSLGFTGKYQFGEAILKDLGYYQPKDNIYYKNGSNRNDWSGTFTGKHGCNSYQDFLTNKQNVQEIAIREEFLYNLNLLNNTLNSEKDSNTTLLSFINKSYKFTGGCNISVGGYLVKNITMAGLLAASHLVGAIGVSNALINGTAPCDEKNTNMATYLDDFDGCDFSEADINEAVASANTNNTNN